VRHHRRAGDVRDQPQGPDPGAAALPRHRAVVQRNAAAHPGREVVKRPRIAILALTLALALAGTAATATATTAATAKTSYTAVIDDLMCVVCHEPLNVAQSPEAFQERQYVRQLIAQGKTKSEIEDDLVQQYGP